MYIYDLSYVGVFIGVQVLIKHCRSTRAGSHAFIAIPMLRMSLAQHPIEAQSLLAPTLTAAAPTLAASDSVRKGGGAVAPTLTAVAPTLAASDLVREGGGTVTASRSSHV